MYAEGGRGGCKLREREDVSCKLQRKPTRQLSERAWRPQTSFASIVGEGRGGRRVHPVRREGLQCLEGERERRREGGLVGERKREEVGGVQ